MNRREAIAGLLALGASGTRVHAQPAVPLRIGWLSAQGVDDSFRSFLEGMAELG